MKTKSIIAIALTLVLSLMCLVGCAPSNEAGGNSPLAAGGVLCLKVNPEIAITYDENGNVTKIDSRNEDARKLLENYAGFEGKACKTVVAELVAAIGDAGYFVEEIEGQSRQITIEIEPGSKLPNNSFLDDVANEVRNTVGDHKWTAPVDVKGESDYGVTDYIDTDYGPGGDGFTDYDNTDYGPNNDGVTDYTDYGTTPTGTTPTQGATDYDDTDYGPNNDGVTDYDDTDYGPNNDGVTDYDDTDYGPNNDGVTDYDDTDYGPNNDGVTDYDDTDYGPNNDGVTDYGKTNYGDSGYDGNSNYGDSRYDD